MQGHAGEGSGDPEPRSRDLQAHSGRPAARAAIVRNPFPPDPRADATGNAPSRSRRSCAAMCCSCRRATAPTSERAVEQGLEVGGWSWDVKIIDVDNDGWQDMLIVNGTWVPNEVTPSKIFYRNTGKGRFDEMTVEFGFEDYLITPAATAIDIDNDGDIDFITHPMNGPPIVFINNSQTGNAITFEFADRAGNSFRYRQQARSPLWRRQADARAAARRRLHVVRRADRAFRARRFRQDRQASRSPGPTAARPSSTTFRPVRAIALRAKRARRSDEQAGDMVRAAPAGRLRPPTRFRARTAEGRDHGRRRSGLSGRSDFPAALSILRALGEGGDALAAASSRHHVSGRQRRGARSRTGGRSGSPRPPSKARRIRNICSDGSISTASASSATSPRPRNCS